MNYERFVDVFFKQGQNIKKTAVALNISVDEVYNLLREPEIRKLKEEYFRKGMMKY